jgi:DNA-binding XRE family transcriptional regulator
MPSNEKLARDLCLSSQYSLKVSRETIRKWLKGDTFPDLDCILHLIDWLGLNMSNIFIDKRVAPQARKDQSYSNHPNDQVVVDLEPEQIDSFIQFLASLKKSAVVKKTNSSSAQ